MTSTDVHFTVPDTRLRIGDELREATGAARYASVSPVTEQVVAEVSAAQPEDVDAAVAAAQAESFGGEWSKTDGRDRGRILARLADLIEADVANVGALETLEMGKMYTDTVAGDIPAAAECFRHFAGWADKIYGSTALLPEFAGRPRFGFTLREPVGVVGAIIPWNNPLMIAAWKIAPALAAGCTVVLKPAEDAALSSLRLGELAQQAGLPDGVLNIVPGLGEVAGAALAQHPGLDKLSFTGSAEVGRQLATAAGDKVRRVTLELGGKSPQLVFPDADLDAVMPWIAAGNFLHQGQICAAGTRVLVHDSLLDDVVAGLTEAARAHKVGDPFDPDNTMGSLANHTQYERVLGYIEAGRREGATLVTGGGPAADRGFFVEPTVFTGDNDLTIAQEEIFGPVATVIPFHTEEEAIAIANATKYGLDALVYTRDLSRAHRVIPALRVGMVWVNGWGAPDPRLPWGGAKASGVGRELGWAGIEAVTTEKTVHISL